MVQLEEVEDPEIHPPNFGSEEEDDDADFTDTGILCFFFAFPHFPHLRSFSPYIYIHDPAYVMSYPIRLVPLVIRPSTHHL